MARFCLVCLAGLFVTKCTHTLLCGEGGAEWVKIVFMHSFEDHVHDFLLFVYLLRQQKGR